MYVVFLVGTAQLKPLMHVRCMPESKSLDNASNLILYVAQQGASSSSKPPQPPRGSKKRQRMLDRAAVWAKGEWTEEASPIAAPVNLGPDDYEEDEDSEGADLAQSSPSSREASSLSSSSNLPEAIGDLDAGKADEPSLPGSDQQSAVVGRGRKRRPRLVSRRT